MLIDGIDRLIALAMKGQDKVRLNAIRGIKAELMKAKTSGNEYTIGVEDSILSKMVKQFKDAIAEFEANSASELAEQYKAELEIIKEFAPKEVSVEDIEKKVTEIVTDLKSKGNISMKEMKIVMSAVKSVYPSADGKIISEKFKSLL